MLGAAVASVSGASWDDYVRQTILTPLGMATTTTDMPFERVGAGLAQGYYVRSADGTRRPVEPHTFRAFAPAAGMASSVNDMARFASWNFRLREKGGEEILKATTLREMQRVHWVGAEFDEPAWGLAFGSRRYGDKTLWGHGGYCPGVRTDFAMRLPAKIGVVMMVTANDVAPQAIVKTVYALTEDAIMAVYGKDASKDDKPAASTVDLSAYEGYYAVENYPWDTYIGLNTDGLFALSLFDTDAVENMETFVHEEGDTFRRKRKDGTLAEAVIFERNAAGQVVAVVQHSYRSLKR
jgi:CubicO group peptidase (beta-lactamase class C family)